MTNYLTIFQLFEKIENKFFHLKKLNKVLFEKIKNNI